MRSPKSSDMWTVTLVINFAMFINHMGNLLCKAALDIETSLATLFGMKKLEFLSSSRIVFGCPCFCSEFESS